jgi:folate-dependent tRNA-U54 methylase TrmFO/GidA
MTREQYDAFVDALIAGEKTDFKEWESNTPYFDGCLPIEIMAARGLLVAAPADVRAALLPVALVRPVVERLERRGYRPFDPADVPQWRRQWALWRAARTELRRAF